MASFSSSDYRLLSSDLTLSANINQQPNKTHSDGPYEAAVKSEQAAAHLAAMASSSSNVVGVHYRVGKKIGEGSFGVIFEGTNLLNSSSVAIKFVSVPRPQAQGFRLTLPKEPRKSDAPQLRDEYRTYKILVGCRKSSISLV